MIALIPIFVDKGDEVYTETIGHELICLFLESVKTAKLIEKIIVITNDKFIHALLDKYRNDTFLVDICKETEMNSNGTLPRGFNSSIQFIEKNSVKDSNLMVLSFRNPLITSKILDDAVSQFFNSDRNLLLSVKESIDNPCQLSTYYKVIDTNVIFLMDTEVDKIPYYDKIKIIFDKLDERDVQLTHPFYFDWDSKNLSDQSKCGVYCRQPGASKISYVPIESLAGRDKRIYGDYDLIIYERKSSARLLSRSKTSVVNFQQDSDYSIAGISLPEKINSNFSVIKNKDNKYFICLSTPLKYNETYILKIHRIIHSSQIDAISTDLIIDSRNHLYEIPGDLHNSTGIICSILRYSEDDDCDLVEPFKPTKKLWDVDAQNTLINSKTGKTITGRQGFPEVFEPEGSFFIMKQEESKNFIRGIINKNSNAYVMKDNESVQIQSKLGYMHYRAVLKTEYSRK